MQQPLDTSTPGVVDFAGDVIEGVSRLPEELRKQADSLNEKLIGFAEGIDREKQETARQVEENLRRQKISSIGSDVATWLQEPPNMLTAFVGVVITIILVRRL